MLKGPPLSLLPVTWASTCTGRVCELSSSVRPYCGSHDTDRISQLRYVLPASASISLHGCSVQRDIRAETCAAFNDTHSSAGAWPSPERNREIVARHLNRKLNFPGGITEARLALSKKVLAPCDPKVNEGKRFKPEMLNTILRRGISRFHRAVLEAATAGFMERAASHLSIGYKGDKGELKFTKADSQRCLEEHWLFEAEFGRDAMLWGLHRALARMGVLREHMVDATATKGKYYKVRYAMYVAIVTKVCWSLVLGRKSPRPRVHVVQVRLASLVDALWSVEADFPCAHVLLLIFVCLLCAFFRLLSPLEKPGIHHPM